MCAIHAPTMLAWQVGAQVAATAIYGTGGPQPRRMGGMPQGNSLSKGAEARLGKTYLAKNKKFIMFHMSMSSREVRELAGSPRASQAPLCNSQALFHAPSFFLEQGNAEAVDLKEAGLVLVRLLLQLNSTLL